MSKALVYTVGAVVADTFRTKWAEFMKNNFAMNMMIYPLNPTIDKSDAKFTFSPMIPEAMIDKGDKADPVFMFVWLKDDTNSISKQAFSKTFADFTEPETVQGQDFLSVASPIETALVGANITAGNKYLVNIVFSNQEITSEVVENPGDMPYSKYGAVSAYVIEVTAVA